jgi:hypothetical protein
LEFSKKLMTKKNQNQDPEIAETGAAGNGSRPASGTKGQGTRNRTNLAAARNATGPRSKMGKRRSSKNAIKFGIFSDVTLLETESSAEYESLRQGLLKSKLPGNSFEEILVDKIVSNLWRQRRALIAEGAEIRRNSEFVESDRRQNKLEEAEEISRKTYPATTPRRAPAAVGLMWSIENSDVLDRCIEILEELRQAIEGTGFDKERDESLLETIYGDPTVAHLRSTLHNEYWMHLVTALMPEDERVRNGYATPEQSVQALVLLIDAEIARLKKYQVKRESIESKRFEVEILRQRVPDSPGLDRLLRYMTALERSFDRTLNDLDRAQRMRKGQPLPPLVDVKIS